jgi:hypothetical protein
MVQTCGGLLKLSRILRYRGECILQESTGDLNILTKHGDLKNSIDMLGLHGEMKPPPWKK